MIFQSLVDAVDYIQGKKSRNIQGLMQALGAVLGPHNRFTVMGYGENGDEAVWAWEQRTAIAGLFFRGSQSSDNVT